MQSSKEARSLFSKTSTTEKDFKALLKCNGPNHPTVILLGEQLRSDFERIHMLDLPFALEKDVYSVMVCVIIFTNKEYIIII